MRTFTAISHAACNALPSNTATSHSAEVTKRCMTEGPQASASGRGTWMRFSRRRSRAVSPPFHFAHPTRPSAMMGKLEMPVLPLGNEPWLKWTERLEDWLCGLTRMDCQLPDEVNTLARGKKNRLNMYFRMPGYLGRNILNSESPTYFADFTPGVFYHVQICSNNFEIDIQNCHPCWSMVVAWNNFFR